MKYYDKLIFELSQPGRCGFSLPENAWDTDTEALPATLRRDAEAELPEVSELDVVRHYTNLSNMNFGVDTGFYPLGSCTMKYNPKINEEIAAMPGFRDVHPLQPDCTVQGALELYDSLDRALAAITGMAHFTLNPFAGAHGELTGLMVMRRYHELRGDTNRTKVIVPDSAHGTNPASAAVCGLKVVEVKSLDDGLLHTVRTPEAAGRISGFMGNFGVLMRAYAYILMLGKQNIRMAGPLATLNANYIKESLKDCYKLPIPSVCKHEFVFDGLADKSTGITTLDIAKRLLDYGFHAPTIYFPLLFHQAIMIEPTETESKETIDEFIDVMRRIAKEAVEKPEALREAPLTTPVRRLDETTAAKHPILTFKELQQC